MIKKYNKTPEGGMTLQEIANELGTTRQQVQIELNRALKKIRTLTLLEYYLNT